MRKYQNTERIKTEAIVLKAIDYQENAQIVSFYGPLGRFNLLVKGTKKMTSKTRGFTEILTLENIDHTVNHSLGALVTAEVLNSYLNIKNDFTKMQIASCMIEKMYFLGHLVKNSELAFTFFKRSLELLEKTKYPHHILCIFDTKLCYLLGIEPIVNKCAICGKENPTNQYFLPEAGGIVCLDCTAHYIHAPLNEENTKNIKYLYLIKLEKVDDVFLSQLSLDIREVNEKIDEYYQRYLDFDSKAKKIYYKLCF